jgi:hypothetical protein
LSVDFSLEFVKNAENVFLEAFKREWADLVNHFLKALLKIRLSGACLAQQPIDFLIVLILL